MQQVIEAIEGVYQRAHDNVKALVAEGDRISAKKLNENQLAAHAVAYLATELEACRQMAAWAERVGRDYEGPSTWTHNLQSPKPFSRFIKSSSRTTKPS